MLNTVAVENNTETEVGGREDDGIRLELLSVVAMEVEDARDDEAVLAAGDMDDSDAVDNDVGETVCTTACPPKTGVGTTVEFGLGTGKPLG